MKVNNLFNKDDRAVSPVIGVILMVAITVILAAVIGTFVLGLGDSLGDNQPSAQLSVDVNEASETITINHNGGDAIANNTIDVRITSPDVTHNGATGTVAQRLSVGDSVESSTFGNSNEEGVETIRVRLIHTPSDSILLDRTADIGNSSLVEQTVSIPE